MCDHHKTWGGKQDRNYFNFTNKDKLRLKQDKGLSPRTLHLDGQSWNSVLTHGLRVFPRYPLEIAKHLPAFLTSHPNPKLQRMQITGRWYFSFHTTHWSPCCLEFRPWARGCAGSSRVGMAKGGSETWQPATSITFGRGEGGEPRAEKPLEKGVRLEEDKKAGASLQRKWYGEQAVGRQKELIF